MTKLSTTDLDNTLKKKTNHVRNTIDNVVIPAGEKAVGLGMAGYKALTNLKQETKFTQI